MRQIVAAAGLGFLAFVATARAGIDIDTLPPDQRCAALKMLAVGNAGAGQINCYKKAIGEPGGVVDEECLAKARLKLKKAFEEAEGLGGCVTIGDADATNARVIDKFGVQVAPLLPTTSAPLCNCGSFTPTRVAITPQPPAGVCGSASGDVPPPLDLSCGFNYFGGGAGLPAAYASVVGATTQYWNVASCANTRLELTATTSGEVGNRACTESGCL